MMWRSLPALEGGQPTGRVGPQARRLAGGGRGGAACSTPGSGSTCSRWSSSPPVWRCWCPTCPSCCPAAACASPGACRRSIAMRGVLAGVVLRRRDVHPADAGEPSAALSADRWRGWLSPAARWAGPPARGSRAGPATRLPRYLLVRAGCLLVAAGIALIALVNLSAVPPCVAAVAWVVGGAGMGMAMASVVLADAPAVAAGRPGGQLGRAAGRRRAVLGRCSSALAGAIYAVGLRRERRLAHVGVLGHRRGDDRAGPGRGGAVRAGSRRRRGPTLPGRPPCGLPDTVRDAS